MSLQTGDASVMCRPKPPSYKRRQNGTTTYEDVLNKCWNPDSTVHWLISLGLINSQQNCKYCSLPMILRKATNTSDEFRWICKKQHNTISIRRGSWFEHANITLEEVMQLTFWWTSGLTHKQILLATNASSTTIVAWMKKCREICSGWVRLRPPIGGQNVVVEIDESKFGKQKYGKGHDVKGAWVFGGREKQNKRNCFYIVVKNRKASTLLPLIQKHVAPGSIIYSDRWKAYAPIQRVLGYRHFTVNHNKHFKDPSTGVHTNGIESDWQTIKRGIHFPEFGLRESHLQSHLDEFVWKRNHEGKDLYLAFLKEVAYSSTRI